jgi:hypothetical protein
MTDHWDIWGRWPSDHDLDLWLVTDDLEPLHTWFCSGTNDNVSLAEIPLPRELWEQAIRAADGLPLDIVLWAEGRKLYCLHVEAPYARGTLGVGHLRYAPDAERNRRRLGH